MRAPSVLKRRSPTGIGCMMARGGVQPPVALPVGCSVARLPPVVIAWWQRRRSRRRACRRRRRRRRRRRSRSFRTVSTSWFSTPPSRPRALAAARAAAEASPRFRLPSQVSHHFLSPPCIILRALTCFSFFIAARRARPRVFLPLPLRLPPPATSESSACPARRPAQNARDAVLHSHFLRRRDVHRRVQGRPAGQRQGG